jgi:hypothetical protein
MIFNLTIYLPLLDVVSLSVGCFVLFLVLDELLLEGFIICCGVVGFVVVFTTCWLFDVVLLGLNGKLGNWPCWVRFVIVVELNGSVPIKILAPVANPNASKEIIIPTNIFPLIFSFIIKHVSKNIFNLH